MLSKISHQLYPKNLWDRPLVALVAPIIVGIFLLFMEYRSGLFESTGSKLVNPSFLLLGLICILIVLLPVYSKRVHSFYERLWRVFPRLLNWLWKQRRYVLLTILFICLEGALYWLYAEWKFIALSVAYLALVMLAILLLAPKRPTAILPLDATDDLIQKIGFDYLPESPSKNGWALAEGALPEFTLADSFVKKALAIQEITRSGRPYALDYDVEPDTRLGKSVEFVTRFKSEAAVYAHFNLESEDPFKPRDGWIKFQIGLSDPEPHPSGNEWTLYVMPILLVGNWQLFRIDLMEAFDKTLRKDGYSFEQFIGFRIRGNLDLAYISVFKSRRRVTC